MSYKVIGKETCNVISRKIFKTFVTYRAVGGPVNSISRETVGWVFEPVLSNNIVKHLKH
jgi:hypothetical protein